MGIWGLLFSSNKRKWISFLTENSEPLDKYWNNKWALIVKNFFIHDNIDFEKYSANAKWENGRLSIYQKEEDLIKCTPTYRKYFVKSTEKRKLNNRNLGVHDWFYLGYPDVAVWFEENYENIEELFNSRGLFFELNNEDYNLEVFKYVVNEYKKIKGKLECAI